MSKLFATKTFNSGLNFDIEVFKIFKINEYSELKWFFRNKSRDKLLGIENEPRKLPPKNFEKISNWTPKCKPILMKLNVVEPVWGQRLKIFHPQFLSITVFSWYCIILFVAFKYFYDHFTTKKFFDHSELKAENQYNAGLFRAERRGLTVYSGRCAGITLLPPNLFPRYNRSIFVKVLQFFPRIYPLNTSCSLDKKIWKLKLQIINSFCIVFKNVNFTRKSETSWWTIFVWAT